MMLLLLLACTGAPTEPTPTEPAGPPVVRTSSFPAWWLVEQLAPEGSIDHQILLPVGEDPPYWSPPGDVVAQFQAADLVVLNGAGFEGWAKTAALDEGKVLDAAEGLELIHIEGPTHSHGKSGSHSHEGADPHTWSDPMVFAKQAERVAEGLGKLEGVDNAAVQQNLATLQGELKTLDGELRAALEPAQGQPMAANHPAFNYLAKAYELDLHSFLWDTDAPVDDPESVDAWLDGRTGVICWWESEPSPAALDSLPEGFVHITIDPLEQPGDDGVYDYLAQARANVPRYQAAFPPEPVQ